MYIKKYHSRIKALSKKISIRKEKKTSPKSKSKTSNYKLDRNIKSNANLKRILHEKNTRLKNSRKLIMTFFMVGACDTIIINKESKELDRVIHQNMQILLRLKILDTLHNALVDG